MASATRQTRAGTDIVASATRQTRAGTDVVASATRQKRVSTDVVASATRQKRDAARAWWQLRVDHGGKIACKFGKDHQGVCIAPTDRQDRLDILARGVCLGALQCSAPDQIPAVRIMPISFAQSNHHDVRVKLSSYGHIWSAISTFYLCIVRPRLAQLRALPAGARHSAPQQHVVLPRRLGVPLGCSETPKCRGRVLGERTPGVLKFIPGE